MKQRMKRLIINVTARDIANGLPRKCDKCPVALAIIRRVDRKYKVEVAPHEVTVSGDSGSVRVTLPESAKDFISSFDYSDRALTKPFHFPLELPAKLVRS
jgi:hypothetical protein